MHQKFGNLTPLSILVDDDKRINISIQYARYITCNSCRGLDSNVLINAGARIRSFTVYVLLYGQCDGKQPIRIKDNSGDNSAKLCRSLKTEITGHIAHSQQLCYCRVDLTLIYV